MKKSSVAIGVIVALGIAWSAGAWFTGKQLESRLNEVIAQTNNQLHASLPQAGLAFNYRNYHRGWFSSQLELVLQPAEGAVNSWLPAGSTIVFNENVEHGPFPLSALSHFNLLPAMGVVQSELVKTPLTESLFAAAGDKSPFNLHTRVSYSGDTASKLAIRAINFTNHDGNVVLDGGDISFNADRDGNNVSMQGSLNKLKIKTENQYQQPVEIASDRLNIDGDSITSNFNEPIGKQTLTIDNLTIAVAGSEMAQANSLKITANSEVTEDGKHLNGQIDYALDALKLQNQTLGSGQLRVEVKNLDGEALQQFRTAYNASMKELATEPRYSATPELYQQKILDAFYGNLSILFKGTPTISIAPLSWKNAQGEATFNLLLALKASTAPATTLADQIANNVQTLEAKLNVPLPAANAFMAQIAQLEGYQPDMAAKLAQQQVKGVSALGQMFQITTEKDNAVQADLRYADGKVSFNGRETTLSDFLSNYTLPSNFLPDTDAE